MAITTKADTRTRTRQTRDALTAPLRAAASAQITARVTTHSSWQSASTVLAYASFGSEVETRALLGEALRAKKRLVLPVGNKDHTRPQIRELCGLDDLVDSPLRGVAHPQDVGSPIIPASEIDLVLVPGIAFDRHGGRVGMGGGFYDRLLSTIPHAQFVALAFSEQVLPTDLPLEAHDVRMHAICTEREWIEVMK